MAELPKKPEDGAKATLDDVAKLEASQKTATEEEAKFEEITQKRLEAVMSGEGLPEEKPAEESEKKDDSTPKPKEESAEESEKKDGSTLVSKEKADDGDKDADKGAGGEKEVPQLSDAYYRAAIHRGMKPEEIEDFYKSNPKLCVQTLGNIYEAVKRSSEEFAEHGRVAKAQAKVEAEAKIKPAVEEKKAEYKGVDFEVLKKTDIDPDILAVIKAQDQQSRLQFEEIQELKTSRSVQEPDQPSGMTPEQARTASREALAIEQRIEAFFKTDDLKGYKDFYGDVPKDAVDWAALTPGQKANRWAVVEMMDDMLTGAHVHNRDMTLEKAMELAHLNVSEAIREQVIRENLKAAVVKRSGSITLVPSGSAKSGGDAKPQTEEELLIATSERLNKLFG